MLPRERGDYSAIVDRPPLKLPDNARIVFWSIVNLEVWDIGKPMARQVLAPPTGETHAARRAELELARIRHAGRRLALLRSVQAARRSRRRSPSMRGSARTIARVAEEAKSDGWEFMGHSYQQGPIHKEPDQKAMIARSLDVLEQFTASGRSAGSARA